MSDVLLPSGLTDDGWMQPDSHSMCQTASLDLHLVRTKTRTRTGAEMLLLVFGWNVTTYSRSRAEASHTLSSVNWSIFLPVLLLVLLLIIQINALAAEGRHSVLLVWALGCSHQISDSTYTQANRHNAVSRAKMFVLETLRLIITHSDTVLLCPSVSADTHTHTGSGRSSDAALGASVLPDVGLGLDRPVW